MIRFNPMLLKVKDYISGIKTVPGSYAEISRDAGRAF